MVTKKRGRKPGPIKGSRKSRMMALKIGESIVFTGEPGDTCSRMMGSLNSTFRTGGLNGQGLTQSAGLTVFEGEVSRPAVKVTRYAEPTVIED